MIAPGLYAAALEDSPLIELPVVVARAGDNAPVSARAQVFIALLEEVVETVLKGHDRLAAKILFALGDWAGRSVQDRHHEVAKLRNRNWTWERNYRKGPLSRDLKAVLLALQRRAEPADGAPGPPRAEPDPPDITLLSERLLSRIGRRRTAYPLDMSLEELHDTGLYVEAGMVRYHDRSSRRGPYSIADLVEALKAGKSVLLLGEPGSGKSLTLYETARLSADHGLIPVPVRAREHRELLQQDTVARIGTETSSVLLVDGLDEAVEPVADRPSVADTLRDLFTTRPSLFTARLHDYEDRLSILLQDLDFDEVCVLRPWEVDREFKEYLLRLTSAELVDEPQLYEAVVRSERLSRLVSRPLYARMLTFIGEGTALSVTEPASLYGEYLGRLAGAADVASPSARGALATWQSAAWRIYVSGHQSGDTISMPELRAELAESGQDRNLRRVLDQIIDTRTVQGRELGEFLHYSFYEYLVAKQVGDLLIDRTSPAILAEMLGHDLTREIRHHLTGRLRLALPRHLKATLLDVYHEARRLPDMAQRRRLIACNIAIYLLSRLIDDSEETLTGLLREEDDTFLREAILWALCHRGSAAALDEFFASVESDPQWRSECRGYVLYYYGDLREGDGPPYYDNTPYRPCTNTYRRIVPMFERSSFIENVHAARRAVDLYTFLDVLTVRSHIVTDDDIRVFQRLVESLRSDSVAATLMARLQEMITSLRREG